MSTITVGKFEVEPVGSIGIWDPCYGHDLKFPAVPGTWEGTCNVSLTSWGKRVTQMTAKLSGHVIETKLLTLGIVGVDSGMMGIYSLSQFKEIDTAEDDYSLICDGVPAAGGFLLSYGFVCSTGYGDGSYKVVGRKDKAGNLVEVTVIFINEK